MMVSLRLLTISLILIKIVYNVKQYINKTIIFINKTRTKFGEIKCIHNLEKQTFIAFFFTL